MMEQLKTREAFDKLLASQTQVYMDDRPKRLMSFSAADLIAGNNIEQLFETMTLTFPGPKAVQASMFSKYYSKMLTSAALFAMTFYDRALDLSPEHVFFETDLNWNPILALRPEGFTKRGKIDREVWRELVVRHIFTDHLTRIFNSLHRHTGIGLKVLWSNVSNYVYWYYPHWIENASTSAERERIEDDFVYLIKNAKKEIFGCNPYQNPLAVEYKDFQHPVFPEEAVKVRETCCLKHCLKDGTYCSTCPKLDDKSRTDMLIELSSK